MPVTASGRHRSRAPDGYRKQAGLPATPLVPIRPRPPRVLLACGLALALAVVWAGATCTAERQPRTETTPIPPPNVSVPPFSPPPAAPTGFVRATELRIPSLGVRSALVGLTVDGAGVMEPPADPAVAGWFTGAAVPGETGPAVIAGHVDSRSGPGIFFSLTDIGVGAVIDIDRSDGRTVRYRVTEIEDVAKNAFPTEEVYGPTPAPELRLITCGGEFDTTARHYLRNVIVSAVLT